MATIIADNIISPLGFTTEETYKAAKSGKSALRCYEPTDSLPFSYTASLFTDDQREQLQLQGYTIFESIAIQSIRSVLSQRNIPFNDRTVLIISSTKGNVGLLGASDADPEAISIVSAANKIAAAIGLSTQPIVTCNACISGVSAMILAKRLIDAGTCDYAIVCGVDVQNAFIISGFQSLKALSDQECRPFDIERLGLNLGECAATVILTRSGESGKWNIAGGAVKNDGIHITNPSPKGVGAHLAISATLDGHDSSTLAQINAHGTATMFNDQMESKAIERSNLTDIPVNALKGYLGHTMGAAGVVETILTMRGLDDGIILGTKGYAERGVSGKISISSDNQSTEKRDFLKIISGFGGCNAAMLITHDANPTEVQQAPRFEIATRVRILPDKLIINGVEQPVERLSPSFITSVYKTRINDYPKFYKMDQLASLGFVASEILLQAEGKPRFQETANRAIAMFNSNGSVSTDIDYLKTISDPNNFFPSPSLFVYTLPNIVTGEIAIRNKYHGETAFYVIPQKDESLIQKVTSTLFMDTTTDSAIIGWIEYKDENDFEADIYLAIKSK